jgi:hypothetical protein
MTTPAREAATPTGVEVLAEVPTYPEAQALVDRLSDAGFPVEQVRIVGTGLHSVEQVTGRLTTGRAALAGAGSGAWLGLFIGLLFGIFAVGPAWLTVLLTSVLIGAFWGALFGSTAHWASRGRRDFSSVQALQAASYQVQVAGSLATQAAGIIGRV